MTHDRRAISRRTFCVLAGSGIGALACSDDVTAPSGYDPDTPLLKARPAAPRRTITPGLYTIQKDAWSSLLLVPERYATSAAMPLIVALHGAAGNPNGPVNFLGPYAEESGFLLLAPKSSGQTWDGVQGIYGPDLATIDGSLEATFDQCRVDPQRIVLQGFSDGASYALGVGITNPELFTRVVAMSPGFLTPNEPQPVKPGIFISHGRQDTVLPIDTASRSIVPALRNAGYDVTYVEFDGMHSVPAAIAAEAVHFMLSA
jgi:predicted esterase